RAVVRRRNGSALRLGRGWRAAPRRGAGGWRGGARHSGYWGWRIQLLATAGAWYGHWPWKFSGCIAALRRRSAPYEADFVPSFFPVEKVLYIQMVIVGNRKNFLSR